jgi:hypothetical protein
MLLSINVTSRLHQLDCLQSLTLMEWVQSHTAHDDDDGSLTFPPFQLPASLISIKWVLEATDAHTRSVSSWCYSYAQQVLNCLSCSRLPRQSVFDMRWKRRSHDDDGATPLDTNVALDLTPLLKIRASVCTLVLVLPQVSLTDDQIRVLSQLTHVTYLDIGYPHRHDSILAMRWSGQQLRTLLMAATSPWLGDCSLHRTTPTEDALLVIPRLAQLRQIEFEYIPEVTLEDGTNLADCAFLREMPQLNDVRLNFSLDYPLTPIFAGSRASCHPIVCLIIRHATIAADLLTAGLSTLTRLQYLHFVGVTLPSLLAFSSVSTLSASLTQLNLRLANSLPSHEFHHIFSLLSLRSLGLCVAYFPPLKRHDHR